MRKIGNSPWWSGFEHLCRMCGGGFTLEADDHIRDSTKKREREDGMTGAFGTRWGGLVKCPYCDQVQYITKFVK